MKTYFWPKERKKKSAGQFSKRKSIKILKKKRFEFIRKVEEEAPPGLQNLLITIVVNILGALAISIETLSITAVSMMTF
jgi:hypothetical protein